MYLPRNLISKLYQDLVKHHHALSPAVLILVSLDPDALCACRILTSLLKRDYVPHKIQPVSGYDDLSTYGQSLVQPMMRQNGGAGGTVVCLGVGGLVDIGQLLGFDPADDIDPCGGVAVWLIDARRPWNLSNVFAGNGQAAGALQEISGNARSRTVEKGKILSVYKASEGGIIVFDDGDIEHELEAEGEAYLALAEMEDVNDVESESDASEHASGEEDAVDGSSSSIPQSRKRKSWSDREEEEGDGSDEENQPPRQRRRSDSRDSITSSSTHDPEGTRAVARSISPSDELQRASSRAPSPRGLRRRFKKIRQKHWATLQKYYDLGTSYSEPISSILYSLAEDLGREDNDMLWWTIVGVSALELYGRSMTGVAVSNALESGGSAGWAGARGQHIRQALRDEVRRLNPPDMDDNSLQNGQMRGGDSADVIPTTGRSPTDHGIRISPEPRLLLIRHWSLYDSMLHSPYLGSRLHIWSDVGRKRLHKLLAKMGISLSQCRQSYTHMDMDLKRGLRQKLLDYAPLYGLEGLVPPRSGSRRGLEGWGFVRCWGWKACLSAVDVGVIVGAILEVGKLGAHKNDAVSLSSNNNIEETTDDDGRKENEAWVQRFWEAYDALNNIETLKNALPTAQYLHRAILRTGTSLIEKRQIRHLKAFRMAVVKEGPDVLLFTHPAALTKLALWVGEAIAEQERERRSEAEEIEEEDENGKKITKTRAQGKGPTPLVLAGLNERRGVYVVVGTGGGGGVVDLEARKRRREKVAEKAKLKEEKKREKERLRSEKREAKRAKARRRRGGDGDADEDDDEDIDDLEASFDEEDDDDETEASSDEEDPASTAAPAADAFQFSEKNRFGIAFQEVVDETRARVRVDSFENCVVEVKREDLSSFLEGLSMKAVVG